MHFLLLISSMAMAAELTCKEIIQMQSIGVPPDAIVEAMEGVWVLASTPECLATSGASKEVVDKALSIVGEPPAEVTPEVLEEGSLEPVVEVQETFRPLVRANDFRPGCSPVELMALPSPQSAGLMSFSYGFGAGHFYLGRRSVGWTMAVAQTAMIAGGWGFLASATNKAKSTELEAQMGDFSASELESIRNTAATAGILFWGGNVGLRALDAINVYSVASSMRTESLVRCQ